MKKAREIKAKTSLRQRGRLWRGVVLGTLLFSIYLGAAPLPASADTLEELQAALAARRSRIRELEERIDRYNKEISERRKEAVSLKRDLGMLSTQINRVEAAITKTEEEIKAARLEIQVIEQKIERTTMRLQQQRAELAAYIREIAHYDRENAIRIILRYRRFSDFVSAVSALTRLQTRGKNVLLSVRKLKQALLAQRNDLKDLQIELETLHVRQKKQQNFLRSQQAAKARLLEITKGEEQKFKELLAKVSAQHKQAQAEVASIEAAIREELRKRGIGELGSPGKFMLPIEPLFGISCGFHCPDYPFKSILGPHTAIDMPTDVGTPVRAAADGYVAKVREADGPGYSYLLILHGDGFSTVYGHLSRFAVREGQFVTRGQVVGYSGGAPGMRGAGLSTGPHLHWEVRINGVPQNPLKYI
jgi:murein DD-endopeptidase MepM/ murein hydrolase activator NlpD